MQAIQALKASASALLITCATSITNLTYSVSLSNVTDTAYTPAHCEKLLHASRTQPYSSQHVMAKQLKVLIWNIYKAQNLELFTDLSQLNDQVDLILLQEATEDPRLIELKPYRRFSPGYKSGDTQTGVMTLSRWPATVHCIFTHREPWLRSLKATNITEYAVAGKRRLLSVNMHSINFTLGVDDYKKQLQDALNIMAGHKGPIIFAGDLNAWSDARQQLVEDSLTQIGLTEATYLEDKRTKVFGLALDQIWTRGVSISSTVVREYESSDHNPILVSLEFH